MACTVSETLRTVQFPAIGFEPLNPAHSAYPYPPLSLGNGLEERQVPLISLENEFLRISCAPSLGGRIVEIFDKRSGVACLEFPPLLPVRGGGRRGVYSPFGLQLCLDGEERLTALGHVDFHAEVDEDGETASVVFAESGTWPLSFHFNVSISAEAAEIEIQVKAFNRSLQLGHYNAGLLLGDQSRLFQTDDGFLVRFDGGRSCHLQSDDLSFCGPESSLTRFDRKRVISPRQLDEWSVKLTPILSRSESVRFGGSVSVSVDDGRVELETSRPVSQLKLVVQSAKGETLEANLTPAPSAALSITLRDEDLPLRGLAVLDQSRNVIIAPGEIGALVPASLSELASEEAIYLIPDKDWSLQKLKEASFDVRFRSLSHHLMALKAVERQDWNEASYQLEQTLLFNGEDHLTWWLKARCERLADADADTSQETLNARFLAPLEPMLRAEALLSQAAEDTREPNPVLGAYSDDRDVMLETSGQLIAAGLYLDAMRLISDWLRYRDFPMLRYLLAYCYLKASKMIIEAAEQVRAASTMSQSGPYPIRPIECQVLRELASHWPDDKHLAYYKQLANSGVKDLAYK